jgi:hypothetical protein
VLDIANAAFANHCFITCTTKKWNKSLLALLLHTRRNSSYYYEELKKVCDGQQQQNFFVVFEVEQTPNMWKKEGDSKWNPILSHTQGHQLFCRWLTKRRAIVAEGQNQ